MKMIIVILKNYMIIVIDILFFFLNFDAIGRGLSDMILRYLNGGKSNPRAICFNMWYLGKHQAH